VSALRGEATDVAVELKQRSLRSSAVSPLEAFYNSLAGQAPAYSVAGGAAFIIGSSLGAAPLAMLITLLGVLPVVYAIYVLSKRYVNAASFYDYVKEGFGEGAGFVNGFVYTIFYSVLGVGSVAIAFGYLGYESIYAITGVKVSPLILVSAPIVLDLAIAYLGIRPSVRTEVALTSIEVAVLLAFSALSVATHLSSLSLYPFTPQATFQSSLPAVLKAISAGLVFGITYFMGFEVSTMISEEARDPRRSVPWATLSATLLMGLLYVIVMYSVLVDIGVSQGSISSFISAAEGAGLNPVYALIRAYLGYPGEVVFAISVLISVLSCYLATLNATARMLYGMSRDGLMPRPLSSVHLKFRSPDVALFTSSALAVLSTIMSYAIAAAMGYRGVALTYNAMEIAYAADTLFYVFSLALVAASAVKVIGPVGKAVIAVGIALLGITFYFSVAYITYMYVFLASLVASIAAYLIARRLRRPTSVTSWPRTSQY
jgi:amino acid transporter